MDESERLSNKIKAYCNLNNEKITDENFHSIAKKALTKEEFESCFLSNEISEKIDKIAIEGEKYFDEEKYEAAIEIYKKGIDLIPEPKNLWETKLWFTSAIADAYWMLDNNKEALVYLDESLEVEEGEKNAFAFVRFRRGQVLYELSRLSEAKKEFKKVYELTGDDLFKDEDEAYLKLINKKRKK